MKDVDKLYDYFVQKDKDVITTKELNQLGYSASYIQKLIDSKVIQREKRGIYTIDSMDLLVKYGIDVSRMGEKNKFASIMYFCYKRIPKNSFVAYRTLANYIENEEYQEAFKIYDEMCQNKLLNREDTMLLLYMFHYVFPLSLEDQMALSYLTEGDILIPSIDAQGLDNNIRRSIYYDHFSRALQLLKEKTSYSKMDAVIGNFSKRLADLRRQQREKVDAFILEKKFDKAYAFLQENYEFKWENHERNLFFLLEDRKEIEKGNIPVITVFQTQKAYEAIQGKNYALALSILMKYKNRPDLKTLEILLRDLIEKTKSIKNIHFSDFVNPLMKQEYDKVSVLLQDFLKQVNKEEYRELFVDFLKVSILQKDFLYKQPIDFLMQIEQNKYHFDLESTLQDFYEALSIKNLTLGEAYLSILEQARRFGWIDLDINSMSAAFLRLERTSTDIENKKEVEKIDSIFEKHPLEKELIKKEGNSLNLIPVYDLLLENKGLTKDVFYKAGMTDDQIQDLLDQQAIIKQEEAFHLTNLDAFYAYGKELKEKGKYDLFDICSSICYQADPTNKDYVYDRLRSNIEQGHYEEAFPLFLVFKEQEKMTSYDINTCLYVFDYLMALPQEEKEKVSHFKIQDLIEDESNYSLQNKAKHFLFYENNFHTACHNYSKDVLKESQTEKDKIFFSLFKQAERVQKQVLNPIYDLLLAGENLTPKTLHSIGFSDDQIETCIHRNILKKVKRFQYELVSSSNIDKKGKLLIRKKEFAKAETLFEKSFALNPSDLVSARQVLKTALISNDEEMSLSVLQKLYQNKNIPMQIRKSWVFLASQRFVLDPQMSSFIENLTLEDLCSFSLEDFINQVNTLLFKREFDQAYSIIEHIDPYLRITKAMLKNIIYSERKQQPKDLSSTIDKIVELLEQKNLKKFDESLSSYLNYVDKSDFRFLILDLLKLDLLEGNKDYHRTMQELVKMKDKDYTFSVDEILPNFYATLEEGKTALSRVYLDIFSKCPAFKEEMDFLNQLKEIVSETENSYEKKEKYRIHQNYLELFADSTFSDQILTNSEKLPIQDKENSLASLEKYVQEMCKQLDQQGGIVSLDSNCIKSKRELLDVIKKMDQVNVYFYGDKDNTKIILKRYRGWTDQDLIDDAFEKAKKAFQEKNFQECLKWNTFIFESYMDVKPYILMLMGVCHKRLGHDALAYHFISLANEMAFELKTGKDYTNLLKRLFPEDKTLEKGGLGGNVSIEEFDRNNNTYGISSVDRLSQMISQEKIPIEEACQQLHLNKEEVNIVKLICARDCFLEDNYEQGNKYLQQVEQSKDKTEKVKRILKEITNNKKIYKVHGDSKQLILKPRILGASS